MSDINDLHFDDKNFNKHTEFGMSLLEKSLNQFGAGRSVLVDKDNNIIAGNGIVEAAQNAGITKTRVIETDGTELVVVKRKDVELNSRQGREMALADNATAAVDLNWDEENLKLEFDDEELKEWGVGDYDDNLVSKYDEYENGALANKFLVPPFSVLDTKQKYWQDMKRKWLKLGIASELGRKDDLLSGLKKIAKEKGLTGTSVFDPFLCELMYSWFNVQEGTVLDPFAGGSVRGIVAGKTKHPYIGLELRQEQVDANEENAHDIVTGDDEPVSWLVGDSDTTLDTLDGEYDMIFSCPPYADLEVYSDLPDDLSNMPYEKFVEKYRSIINKSVDHLKNNRFAVFVVSEVRDKSGSYRSFVNDTIKAFTDAGLLYYNEIILVNAIGTLALRAGKCFSSGRKVGRTHQNILVFYKGAPKEIKNNYKEIDFTKALEAVENEEEEV